MSKTVQSGSHERMVVRGTLLRSKSGGYYTVERNSRFLPGTKVCVRSIAGWRHNRAQWLRVDEFATDNDQAHAPATKNL